MPVLPFILPTGSYLQSHFETRLQAINIANSSKQTELHRIAGLGFPVYTRRISSDTDSLISRLQAI